MYLYLKRSDFSYRRFTTHADESLKTRQSCAGELY